MKRSFDFVPTIKKAFEKFFRVSLWLLFVLLLMCAPVGMLKAYLFLTDCDIAPQFALLILACGLYMPAIIEGFRKGTGKALRKMLRISMWLSLFLFLMCAPVGMYIAFMYMGIVIAVPQDALLILVCIFYTPALIEGFRKGTGKAIRKTFRISMWLSLSIVCFFSLTWMMEVYETENWIYHAAGSFDGGTGTKNDPYLIATPRQLVRLARLTNGWWVCAWNREIEAARIAVQGFKNLPEDMVMRYYGIVSDTLRSPINTSTMSSDPYVKWKFLSRYLQKRDEQIRELYAGAYFQLTEDIDLSGKTWTPIGNVYLNSAPDTGDKIVKKFFRGHFDGNGKVIRNLDINSKRYERMKQVDMQALFSVVFQAEIKDMTISEAIVKGVSHVSVLCAYAVDSRFVNCTVSGAAEGAFYVGGLTGEAERTSIDSCTTKVTVDCRVKYSGGIAGKISSSSVTNSCVSSGKLKAGQWTHAEVIAEVIAGGIAGEAICSEIQKCFVIDNPIIIEGPAKVGKVGGITGHGLDVELKDCLFDGQIYSYAPVGGIVGYLESQQKKSVLENCTFNGLVQVAEMDKLLPLKENVMEYLVGEGSGFVQKNCQVIWGK